MAQALLVIIVFLVGLWLVAGASIKVYFREKRANLAAMLNPDDNNSKHKGDQ